MTSDEAKIKKLSERLGKMAQAFSKQTVQTADDLYQSMIAYLLERQAKDPSFFDQKDSYILDAGRKMVCLPARRRAKIESRYTCGEPQPTDDDSEYFFDTLPGPGVNPETACENLEQALALAELLRTSLSGKEREVLTLAVSGADTAEIATKLNTSTAAVGVYKNRIAKKLQVLNFQV